MRLPARVLCLALVLLPAQALARPLSLPVHDPRSAGFEAPCYTAEKLEIRLRPAAAAVARARFAGRTPAPTAVRLGLPGVDAALAALGAWIEPEFRGESPPADPREPDFTAFYIVHLTAGAALDQVLDQFAAEPEVDATWPIAILPVDAMPDDSLFPDSWWHYQPARTDIHSPEAWDISRGDSTIVVGIIDTGVCPYHPDLEGQIWSNPAEVNGLPGVDDDGNGYVDDTWGWDFVAAPTQGTVGAPGEDATVPDNDPNDFAGHGTFVAGEVGARGNNGIGVAGVAWNTRIMPLRIGWAATCLGCRLGIVDMSYAAQALRYAARMGAAVVNCSFSTLNEGGLDAAATVATHAGVVIVSAAGNSGEPRYLATRSDVIAVAATDRNDVVAGYSNRGTYVDLAAPGSNLVSTFVQSIGADSISQRQPTYGMLSGTSMSAPLVAGGVALLQALRRATGQRLLSPRGAQLRLMETADDISAANPGNAGYGVGRLNLGRLLADPPHSRAWTCGASTIGPAVTFTRDGQTLAAWLMASQQLLIENPATGDTVALASLPGIPARHLAGARMGGGVGFALFAGTYNGRVAGFDSTGAPLPHWPVTGPAGLFATLAGGPVLADLDGDGVREVVCGGDDGKVWAWHVDGSRVTNFPVVISSLGVHAPVACAAIDSVPGDEIVAVTQEGDVHVLNRDGNELDGFPFALGGIPVAPVVAWVADSARIVVASGTDVRMLDGMGQERAAWTLGGSALQDPAVGDVDGDGTDEIVIGTSAADLEVLRIGGSAPAGWPALLPSSISGPPVLGHVAGREAADALAMTGLGLYAVRDTARLVGTFPKVGGAGQSPTLLDLDHDGATEVLAGGGDDSLIYIYDAGPRSWNTTPQPWPTPRGNFARTGARPRDAMAPASVTDLSIVSATPDAVVLAWTAPGDDGMTGRASAYELRWTTLVSLAGTTHAGNRVAGVPAPDSAGTLQQFAVTGLAPNTRCWFWLRTVDDAGNESGSSNVAAIVTPIAGPELPNVFELKPRGTVTGAPVRVDWRVRAGASGRVEFYDVSGRRVRSFAVGPAPAGSLEWNGRDAVGNSVPAGVYFARLACGSLHLQTRVVLLP
jgi:subtilase family protein